MPSVDPQSAAQRPTPELIFETLNAHHRTAALKAAIELDVFTAIGEGAGTTEALAKRCQATERGVRILCDNLAIIGLLKKHGAQYSLTPDSAMFLDRRSPVCVASMVHFMALPEMVDPFKNLTATIRSGLPATETQSAIPDDPVWVEFARSMMPLQIPLAENVARTLNADAGERWKVLDIAAGHGMFGIALAKHNPNAEIYAGDSPNVLEVAKENAKTAGVASRFHTLPGSAFEIDLGYNYDIVLLTNFLQLFDEQSNENLLRKLHAALAPGGRVVTVGFVANEDRVTPPRAAAFSLIMLGTTRGGDAYTHSEYDRMFRNAGFSRNELRPMPMGPQSLIISQK
ncbi:MAG TPA: class I SAM-dependent methyltransferase [Candidatus Acidoferrum sp.]|nr:class I SAM-dependent methyltransferase [Candidatus Acidoferrum sp.]